MASVKLTKNELKNQKEKLKQFERFLPTLQLKKQQLQTEMARVTTELADTQRRYEQAIADLDDWVAVYAENAFLPEGRRLEDLVRPNQVDYVQSSVAGVSIPVFRQLTFCDITYEVEDYPLWVDTAAAKLKDMGQLQMLLQTLQIQMERLERELRLTSQRVNLFEKVKIPEANENIRVISIYLGDQQTSAVVRGKIAKKKRQEVGHD